MLHGGCGSVPTRGNPPSGAARRTIEEYVAAVTSLRLRGILHRHRPVREHVVVQRAGIPYELERTVCRACAQVLAERRLGRAVAA